ncbi:MAG: phosphoribosylanthranilate isomerase [Terracidiphilus sp.]|jgi:phosphoribosylanthranilate isomerase
MSIWIKICGNTSIEDALLGVEAGADALGFVFAPSPRRVSAAQAAVIVSHLPAKVEKIGVFVDTTLDAISSTVEDCGLTGVQLHFDAPPELPARIHERLRPELRILRVLHFGGESSEMCEMRIAAYSRDTHVDAVLVDSRAAKAAGGTGVAFDWVAGRETLFQDARACKLIAAGGLTPENVSEAISTLRPWGVDAVSGVETAPGRKDPAKVREFVLRARGGNTRA